MANIIIQEQGNNFQRTTVVSSSKVVIVNGEQITDQKEIDSLEQHVKDTIKNALCSALKDFK